MIRSLAAAGDGRVLAQDLVACGVPKMRAAAVVRRYFGPDLSRMEPDDQGRVKGTQVIDAYRLCPGTLYRSMRLGRVKTVGKAGRSHLFNYEQVRKVFG